MIAMRRRNSRPGACMEADSSGAAPSSRERCEDDQGREGLPGDAGCLRNRCGRRRPGRGRDRRHGPCGGALVVGGVGIGLATAPDAGTAPAAEAPRAEQRADAERKTPAPATGAGAEGARAADPAEEEAPGAAEAPAAGAAQADPAAAEAPQGSPEAQGAPEAGEPRASQSPKSGSGSGSEKAAPAPEKKPAHEHSWQPVTEKRWVENWVTVTDQAAWDEAIPGRTVFLCKQCGGTFDTNSDAADHPDEASRCGDPSGGPGLLRDGHRRPEVLLRRHQVTTPSLRNGQISRPGPFRGPGSFRPPIRLQLVENI